MSTIVALQMDPLENLQPQTDTTCALAREAMRRGFQTFHYTPEQLIYQEGRILARGHWITIPKESGTLPQIKEKALLDLTTVDYVLIRQDPPFDLAYITTTHVLEHLPPTARVINHPVGVRNAPEKLMIAHFHDLMAPTLITHDLDTIIDFIQKYRHVVIKPLYEFGGAGVVTLKADDPNLLSLLEMFKRRSKEPPIVQKYLPEIIEGDRRIILINGEPAGIYQRIPPAGQIRSNARAGGTAVSCDFRPNDLEICKRIGSTLREQGLFLAGVDVIGDYLTEINVTSPTGLPVIENLYGKDLAVDFWDAASKK